MDELISAAPSFVIPRVRILYPSFNNVYNVLGKLNYVPCSVHQA